MEKLEKVLAQVENLRRDLSAEKEIGGHYVETEGVWVGGSRGGSNPGYWETEPYSGYVCDYEPDIQKRESAKQQLQQFYDNSEWYSARYIAGRALSVKDNEPEGRLKKWVDELKEQLKSEIVLQEEKIHHQEEKYCGGSGHGDSCIREDEHYIPGGWIIDEPAIIKPDEEKRKKAKQDLDRLKTELKGTYNNKSIFSGERAEAGKALGYSSLRILTHENPITAAISGIATVGTASGLGYLIYQYLNK